MSRLVEHAVRELELSGQYAEDPPYAQTLVATVAAFCSYRHSGGSASVALEQLDRLLRWEALSPLTSDPADWEDRTEMSGYPLWQNRRDSRAMSKDGGQTWWYVSARHAGEPTEAGRMVSCSACHGLGVVEERERDATGEDAGP